MWATDSGLNADGGTRSVTKTRAIKPRINDWIRMAARNHVKSRPRTSVASAAAENVRNHLTTVGPQPMRQAPDRDKTPALSGYLQTPPWMKLLSRGQAILACDASTASAPCTAPLHSASSPPVTQPMRR